MRITVLLWFSSWMVILMPGHTRGIVKRPGTETEQAASCCQPRPACCSSEAPHDEPCDKPKDPAKHCAICFLNAHLTNPPPLTLYTPFLGELDELAYDASEPLAEDLAVPERSRGRAPPA